VDAGLPFKSALTGLELAAIWLRQGRADEATRTVRHCTTVFLALGIDREVLASVLLLQKAGEMREVSLALLDAVITSLRRVEREPGAHPQPAAEG
jgi:hypothetical protein